MKTGPPLLSETAVVSLSLSKGENPPIFANYITRTILLVYYSYRKDGLGSGIFPMQDVM